MSAARVTATRPAGPDAVVLTREGGGDAYRRRPCSGCPWRVDQVGSWPAEAFQHSAGTAADLATHEFGCHETAQTSRAATCAGFLLRGAEHNLSVRMRIAEGRLDPGEVDDGGHELHEDYVAMAIANGVDPSDPALARCRRAGS